MKFPRSVFIDEEIWDELIQRGYERAAVEGRQVNASELARRGIHRELSALAEDGYTLPDGYEDGADVARQDAT